jgi:hypothetical protein
MNGVDWLAVGLLVVAALALAAAYLSGYEAGYLRGRKELLEKELLEIVTRLARPKDARPT